MDDTPQTSVGRIYQNVLSDGHEMATLDEPSIPLASSVEGEKIPRVVVMPLCGNKNTTNPSRHNLIDSVDLVQ